MAMKVAERVRVRIISALEGASAGVSTGEVLDHVLAISATVVSLRAGEITCRAGERGAFFTLPITDPLMSRFLPGTSIVVNVSLPLE